MKTTIKDYNIAIFFFILTILFVIIAMTNKVFAMVIGFLGEVAQLRTLH